MKEKTQERDTQERYTKEEIFGREPNRYIVATGAVGLLVILVAALVPIANKGFDAMWYRYLYAAGALMVLTAKLFTPYTGKVMRMKRLARLEAWSGIFFCVAAFFMFYDHGSNRDWLAFTLAGGAIQLISNFLMGRVARKLLNSHS